jgi:hypothetical protein
LWPVIGPITSSFGQREDPITGNGEGEFHTGIDISAPMGTPVRATADGTVKSAEMENGYVLARVGHVPHRAAAVVGDEQRAVIGDRHADRPAPDLAVRVTKPVRKSSYSPVAWPSCMGMRITS